MNSRQKQFVATELERLLALHGGLRGLALACSWAHLPEPVVRLAPTAWLLEANTGFEGRWPRLCLEVLVHLPMPTLRLVLLQPRGPGPDLSGWLQALNDASALDDSGIVAPPDPTVVPPQFSEVPLWCPHPLEVPLGASGGEALKDYAGRLDQALMRGLRSELYQHVFATVSRIVATPSGSPAPT